MSKRLAAQHELDEDLSSSLRKFDYVTTCDMPLSLIATPIGNPDDITLRALQILKDADIVIGEEHREVSTLLKRLGITDKRMELLNEHSKDDDVMELLEFCKTSKVALVSDCGTPGFCDPGARLVAACRREGLTSEPIPGASSLMCLLSMSGQPMNQFRFRGFLPADKTERKTALQELAREKVPVILMDTPYRMGRLLTELAEAWPQRRALIGCDFTQPNELILEDSLIELSKKLGDRKSEFILALFPDRAGTSEGSSRGSGQGARHVSGRVSGHVSGHNSGQGSGVRPRSSQPKRRPKR